jgi:predicted molibdopterin-dependent oxidoreductase YjgC
MTATIDRTSASLSASSASSVTSQVDVASTARYAQPMKREYKRLTQPLVRDAGALRPASWDEALARAAGGFRNVTERHGAKSFGLFSCSKATNEVNYLAQKFARGVIGSHNVDSCNRT